MRIKKIEIGLRARLKPQREALLKHIKSAFFRDIITQLLLIPSVFLLLAAWIIAIYYFRATEYLVPLRYNSFVGVYSLGNWYDPFIVPIVLTVSFIANVLLGKAIYSKDKFLGYILVATNIFLAIVGIVVIYNFGRINVL